jgi:hypothetical protein
MCVFGLGNWAQANSYQDTCYNTYGESKIRLKRIFRELVRRVMWGHLYPAFSGYRPTSPRLNHILSGVRHMF